MTEASTAAAPDPFAAMMRLAFWPSVLVGLVAAAVLGGLEGASAGLSGLLGVAVAVAFFAAGLLVMVRLRATMDPLRFVALALAVVLGQLIFLLVVILLLDDAAWLDGTAFGVGALVVALAWQVLQIVAWSRTRRLAYDDPAAPAPDEVAGPEPR